MIVIPDVIYRSLHNEETSRVYSPIEVFQGTALMAIAKKGRFDAVYFFLNLGALQTIGREIREDYDALWKHLLSHDKNQAENKAVEFGMKFTSIAADSYSSSFPVSTVESHSYQSKVTPEADSLLPIKNISKPKPKDEEDFNPREYAKIRSPSDNRRADVEKSPREAKNHDNPSPMPASQRVDYTRGSPSPAVAPSNGLPEYQPSLAKAYSPNPMPSTSPTSALSQQMSSGWSAIAPENTANNAKFPEPQGSSIYVVSGHNASLMINASNFNAIKAALVSSSFNQDPRFIPQRVALLTFPHIGARSFLRLSLGDISLDGSDIIVNALSSLDKSDLSLVAQKNLHYYNQMDVTPPPYGQFKPVPLKSGHYGNPKSSHVLHYTTPPIDHLTVQYMQSSFSSILRACANNVGSIAFSPLAPPFAGDDMANWLVETLHFHITAAAPAEQQITIVADTIEELFTYSKALFQLAFSKGTLKDFSVVKVVDPPPQQTPLMNVNNLAVPNLPPLSVGQLPGQLPGAMMPSANLQYSPAVANSAVSNPAVAGLPQYIPPVSAVPLAASATPASASAPYYQVPNIPIPSNLNNHINNNGANVKAGQPDPYALANTPYSHPIPSLNPPL